MENLEKHSPAFTLVTTGNLYDLSMLEEMEDTEYLLEVLDVLLKETPGDIKEMTHAVEAGKADMVCKKAHKLKGSAGVIQAEKLIEILEDIEAIGKKGVVNIEMRSFIENAEHEYNRIEKALKIYMDGLK